MREREERATATNSGRARAILRLWLGGTCQGARRACCAGKERGLPPKRAPRARCTVVQQALSEPNKEFEQAGMQKNAGSMSWHRLTRARNCLHKRTESCASARPTCVYAQSLWQSRKQAAPSSVRAHLRAWCRTRGSTSASFAPRRAARRRHELR
eukprot:6193223-Pleurochrysis_carterae.AAC.1